MKCNVYTIDLHKFRKGGLMSKKDDDFSEIETVETGPTYFLEEDIYVPEEIIKNKALIRMDMNIVQFPIFSKNAKRKKNEITTYFFNKNKDTYITIKPTAGELIPGEAEEKIFIALMKLMKDKGMEQEFTVTAKEIKDAAKIHASNYINEIKKALLRLSETNYNFKNTMYSNETGSILKNEISTPILTFKSLQLNLAENKKLKKKINDNRIKEIYQIKISDHFYKNIVKRGYLVYDSNILLDINSGVARTLYMLLEKIRFDKLYIKESVFALIKKIPLKYEKRSLPVTIKTLEKALNELKSKKLIKEFSFFKPTTWLEADVEVFFEENHNILKQERFDDDNKDLKKIYTALAISSTEKKHLEELEAMNKEDITKEMVEGIIKTLPKKAKALKSIYKTVELAIEKYGLEKVKGAAIYLSNQKNLTSPRAYFLKILENDWAGDILVEKETKETKQSVINSSDEKIEKTNEKVMEYFLNLSEDEKLELEKKAYEEYIKECGQETKIQKMAFNAGKNTLICKFIEKHGLMDEKIEELEVNNSEEKEDKEISKLDILNDTNAFNDYIDKSIEFYRVILNMSDDRIFEIKKTIAMELSRKFILKEITIDDIDRAIAKQIQGGK